VPLRQPAGPRHAKSRAVRLLHFAGVHVQLPDWRTRPFRDLGPLRSVATGELPAQCYKSPPGAAGTIRGRRQRREPERTVLHKAVRERLRTFLDEARTRTEDGAGLPRFVEAEFERYLACGIFAHGFARVRCGACGHEVLVASGASARRAW